MYICDWSWDTSRGARNVAGGSVHRAQDSLGTCHDTWIVTGLSLWKLQSHALAWGICGSQNGTGQVFSPSFRVHCQCHPPIAQYLFIHQSLALSNLSTCLFSTGLPSLQSFCSFGLCCAVNRTVN